MLIVLLLALLACTGLQPVLAAQVSFQNCLSSGYKDNTDPVLLQWVPLYVDASFDTGNDSHRLVVTMYGNVTGSRSSTALPAWNSSEWDEANFTDGKILQKPEPDSASPKLTTLHSKVDVLTYEPYSNDTDFCATSLTNASCPLGPVFNTSVVNYYDLPSVSLANDFYSSYAFTSFSATFIIRYGDDAVTTIGCVSTTVTPDLGGLASLIKFLPMMVLLSVGIATVFAGIYSPWGTMDVFHWTSNYGRDPDLLRLVTPGFGDCLQYLQFAVLTGGLTLSYPGYYQPIVSQAAWSTLMFNQSFVSKYEGMPKVVDGIYYTNGTFGLQNLSQLAGMASAEDVWPGMMVWLLVIVAAVFVFFQLGFGIQWVYRFVCAIPEEDLRSKNWPFSVGNVIRVIFNYFLLPLVALSTFQFVVGDQSPAYTTALAAITLFLIIGFAAWLLRLIITTKPRAVLFDDLSTLLLYGPLYNTYSDEAAAYALTPLLLTLLRGIAIGAVQPAGIAQIVLLAICEVIQILTLHAFHPFHSQSSMNAYHFLFAALRFITIMLMIAFIPALGVGEGPKGWIGYVILVIHGGVLILGFFLNALQTVLEVIARMAGAGGDDIAGQTRGGLSKIFGMRQLSRRMPRRGGGAVSRQSQLSSSAMLDSEEIGKTGYVMPGGRLRSESAGSIGVLMAGKPGQRSSSALDNLSLDGGFGVIISGRNMESGSFTPTTTGEMSNFSYLPSPNPNNNNNRTSYAGAAGVAGAAVSATAAGATPQMESTDPYYRPPRRPNRRMTADRDTLSSPADRTRGSWASGDWTQRPAPAVVGHAPSTSIGSVGAAGGATSGGAAPAAEGDAADFDGQQPTINLPTRTDYTTREVDFYYGVRGQRLNSEAPGRKLGTGPADPTGPMASAAGWFRTILGGKSKDKGKGFEVVRSSRMPAAMIARGGDFEDEGPPPGIPVAMNVIRNGPIESDDEEDEKAKQRHRRSRSGLSGGGGAASPGSAELLDDEGNPGEEVDETGAARDADMETLHGDDEVSEVSSLSDETSSDVLGHTRISDVPPELPNIDAGSSIHMPSRLPSRRQSQASRQPSRHQSQVSRRPSRHPSQASRYAAPTGANVGTGIGIAVGDIPPVPILDEAPKVPRKSSRRSGSHLTPTPEEIMAAAAAGIPHHPEQFLTPPGGGDAVSRLPFDRSNSMQRQHSSGSSNAATTEEFSQIDLHGGGSSSSRAGSVNGEQPTNIGFVQQGSVSHIEPHRPQDLLGSSAEVVNDHERR